MPHTISAEYLRLMALYGKWQNSHLLGLCEPLGETALRAERELFFGSIFATLDHILHVDRVILDFVASGEPPAAFDPKARNSPDFATLRRDRMAMDAELVALADTATQDWLDSVMVFENARWGGEVHRPRALMLMQLFNHETHHRSQATSALHRMGIDYGSTDMPFNPLVEF